MMNSSFSLAASLLLFSSLVIACVAEYGEGRSPAVNEESLAMAVEGLIMCKTNDRVYPLQGAKARITCVGEKVDGEEVVPFSFWSGATDTKGYFFQTLYASQLRWKKTAKCRVFLYSSPDEECSFRTDENRGIKGAPLSKFRVLPERHMKLYYAGPFYFSSEPTYY